MKHVEVVIDNPKVHDSETVARSTAQQRAVPPWKDRLRPWLLSIHLQSALQIAAGTFVACLFTFIRPIAFPQSCVIATLFLVVSVMMSPNNHLGTRINAAASLLGSLWIGAVVAAVVATLAKVPGPGATSTAIYIILGAVTIAVLSINRVGTTPPTLWSLGMVNCLAFGLVALSSWKLHSIQQVWMVTGFIVLAAVVAAVIGTLTAALVMPTLASEKVQELLADVLQSAGTATSRYSARLFRPQSHAHTQPQQPYPQQASKDVQDVTGSYRPGATGAATGVDQSMSDGEVTLSAGAAALDKAGSIYSLGDAGAAFVLDDPMTDEQWLELIRLNSSPDPSARPKAYVCPMPQANVGLLRPKLAEVQNMLLPAAAVEPPWLRGLCGPNGHWFDAAAWGRVVQAVQVLIIRLSALEAVVEDGESLHEYGWLSSPELLARLRLVYSQTATSLALMAHTVKTYGSPTTAAAAAAGSAADGPFCVMVGAFGASWREAKRELTAFMQQHFESHWKRMASAPPGSPVTLPSLTNVRHLMFGWVLTNSIITAIEHLETALAAAVCNAPPPSLLTRLFSWLTPLWPLICGKYLFVNWHRVLVVDLPAAIKQGSAGVNKVFAQPLFQAGLKYWLVLVLVYSATLLAMHFDTAIASLTPAFGYVAAVLTMSERVEATVSKVSFWVAGTIAGGALGFLAMLHPLLATNPYALSAIMAVAAFLVGLLGQTRARVMITLTLMTLSALVLCQYNAVSAGRGEVAAARVVSVIAGVLTAVVVCNIILPWYTSNWAIQTMCQAYENSIQLLCELLAKSYQVGAEAAASHHTNAATTTLHPTQPSAAAAAQLAAALAAAAADAFPDALGCATTRDPGNSAALQAEIARPLVAVQVSLMRDTVAWRRGVLATPPIVPQLLSSLQALLDRLAALQLALNPPKVTGVVTGRHVLWFGVPMKDNLVYLMELHGLLAAAVAAAVMHPESKTHTNAVKILVKSIEHHRTNMFKQMMHLRKELHIHALQQQQLTAATVACAAATTSADKPQQQQQRHSDESPACVDMRQQIVEYFGTADDAVAYLGFQFALLKALDKTAAVAKVVLQDSCKARNSTRCTMV